MELTRRSFFKGILAAAAAGTLITKSNELLAMVLEEDRYTGVLRRARAVLDYLAPLPKDRDWFVLTEEQLMDVTHMGDDMVLYAMDNFPGVPSVQDVRDLFNGKFNIDLKDDNALRNMAEAVVPVAVLRELLSKHRVPMVPLYMTCWDEFIRRYKDVILDKEGASV